MGGQFFPPQCDGQMFSACLARGWLAVGIDVGSTGLRVQAAKDRLPHVRRALDEADRTGAALEEPEIAVAGHVDQPFHRAATTLVVDEDWGRHLVPVPRVVGVVLEVAAIWPVVTSIAIVEAVYRLSPGRWSPIHGPPLPVPQIRQARLRIVVARHPYRGAARLPLIAGRPRLAAGLAGRGHCVGLPQPASRSRRRTRRRIRGCRTRRPRRQS